MTDNKKRDVRPQLIHEEQALLDLLARVEQGYRNLPAYDAVDIVAFMGAINDARMIIVNRVAERQNILDSGIDYDQLKEETQRWIDERLRRVFERSGLP